MLTIRPVIYISTDLVTLVGMYQCIYLPNFINMTGSGEHTAISQRLVAKDLEQGSIIGLGF